MINRRGCTITEKALVGAFSVIVKAGCETDGLFYITNDDTCLQASTIPPM